MYRKLVAMCLLLMSVTFARAAEEASPGRASDPQLASQIGQLVEQLDSARAEERDMAEKKLLELAGSSAAESDRFLELLPEDSDQMPLAVRDRLANIRHAVEDRVAKSAVAATNVTLAAANMPLAEVFAAIEKQTANRLVDNRQQDAPDEGATGGRVTIELKDEPFWPAIDKLLDVAQLDVYSYGGESVLSIVSRSPENASRFGRAQYSGPFRFEIMEIQSQRNLRQPQRKSLKLQVEVAWEPRLRPIALSQPIDDIQATTDTGSQLPVSQPEAVLDVEVPDGTQAAEILLALDLPARNASRITSLRGKLRALVPGRQVKFRFDEIAKASGKSQQRGGVRVTIDDVRQNNAIWEVHMRLTLDEGNQALESHRGWVLQNKSYFVGADGESIDNAGLETTRQTENEVGVAYLFDLPDGLNGLSWVYETPAAIVEFPVEYEINDIELP